MELQVQEDLLAAPGERAHELGAGGRERLHADLVGAGSGPEPLHDGERFGFAVDVQGDDHTPSHGALQAPGAWQTASMLCPSGSMTNAA